MRFAPQDVDSSCKVPVDSSWRRVIMGWGGGCPEIGSDILGWRAAWVRGEILSLCPCKREDCILHHVSLSLFEALRVPTH